MVLNVQDEVINGTPKYNITPNGDGTNSIELANEVTQSGSPLNKALFDKIENVLSYQIPSYEQVQGQTPIRVITPAPVVSITPTWSGTGNIGTSTLSGALTSINDLVLGTYTPTFDLVYDSNSTTNYGWKVNTSGTKFYATIMSDRKGKTSTEFIDMLNQINDTSAHSGSNRAEIRFISYQSDKVEFIYDFKHSNIKKALVIGINNSGTTSYLYESDDGLTWTRLDYDISWGLTTSKCKKIENLTKRYYKIESTNNNGGGTPYFEIYSIYWNIEKNNPSLENNYETDNIQTLYINNQRLLINTPANVSTTNVLSNKINNIRCDTLLTANKYYELLYKQDTDKFIAYAIH